MTTIELKKYIFKNNKIEYVLDKIDCKNIVYHPNKDYYSCSNVNGDNPAAINVKNNEYLNVVNYTRTKDFGEGSDIITLVQYNKKYSFIEAIKYLHKILDLNFKFNKQDKQQKKYNPLEIFKRCLSCHRRVMNVDEIHTLDDKLLNDYVPMLHIDFLREGIMPWTRDKFKLAYSYRHKRVIIPHFLWCTGELIGTNARTVVSNYKEFGITKYILTTGMQKELNLYGLWQNYDSIQKAKYVVVAESEKSCLKRHSLGDETVVSLSGKTISAEQRRILIGLNTEIIIGLDKDVDINEIRHICEKFYRIRPVSYIYDKWDLLNEKDAPMDARNQIYEFLFKHRVKYDDFEHRLYLQSLEKR